MVDFCGMPKKKQFDHNASPLIVESNNHMPNDQQSGENAVLVHLQSQPPIRETKNNAKTLCKLIFNLTRVFARFFGDISECKEPMVGVPMPRDEGCHEQEEQS